MNESWAIGRPGQSLIGTRVEVVELQRQRALPARVAEAGGRVDDQAEAPERATCPRCARRCRRAARPTPAVRPRQNSPGWMTNGSPSLDDHLLGEVARRVAQVDRRHAVVVEDAERVAEAQVDARRLDHRRRPTGRCGSGPRSTRRADRAVGEDGGRRHRPKSRTARATLSVRGHCVRAQPPSECGAAAAARLRRAGRDAGRAGGARADAAVGGSPPSPLARLLGLLGRLR